MDITNPHLPIEIKRFFESRPTYKLINYERYENIYAVEYTKLSDEGLVDGTVYLSVDKENRMSDSRIH